MSDAYHDAGYGSGEIGFGERPVILVVDFQLAFTDPSHPLGGSALIDRAVERTARLLDVARRRGVPVACSYTEYASERDMPYWKVDAVRKDFRRGHPCTRLDPRIHDPDYDFAFGKGAPSMFFQTPLVPYLVKHRVDTTIVTGCTTSGCVRATVNDAFSYGYRTILAHDCSGDAEEGPHRTNIEDIARRYADVVSADDVSAYLDRLR